MRDRIAFRAAVFALFLIGGPPATALFHSGAGECSWGVGPVPPPPVGDPSNNPGAPAPTPPPPPIPRLPPSPNGPSTGRHGAGSTNGPRPGPGTRGGAAAATRRGSSEGEDRWEYWWFINQEAYLRRRAAPAAAVTTSADPRLPAAPLSAALLHVKVLPALLTATQDGDVEVSDSAALALGRCVSRDEANLALVPLTRQLSHAEAATREAAVLAMGMVASPAAIPTLHALLADSETGRSLTRHPAGVEERVRAVAAVSLGLIGERGCAAELLDGFARPTASYEIQQACVCALGLLHEADEGIVARLLAILEDRTLPPFVRCHVPEALGHLVAGDGGGPARAAVTRLATLLRDANVDDRIRRGIPPALARMAALEDAELVQLLIADAKDDSDVVTRACSLIALGDLEAADRDPAAHAKAHDAVTDFLVGTLHHPSRVSLRSFAALALGIGAGNEARPQADRDRIATLLRAQLAATADPATRGALAVALGLAGAVQSLPDLDLQWAQARDPVLRGALATAYGLLGAQAAADRLHEELFRPGVTMNETLDLAHALALIARPDTGGRLIGRLEAARSVAEVGPAALALGFVGDAAAVDPLLVILGDPSAPAVKRAAAVESLGLLTERNRVSWHARYSIGSNYTLFGPTMNRLVGLL